LRSAGLLHLSVRAVEINITRGALLVNNYADESRVQSFLNAFPRSPEYMSLFIDGKLRKGMAAMSDAQADELLEKVLQIFRCAQCLHVITIN
jgi:Cullin family